MKLLIADDSKVHRLMLGRTLTNLGHEFVQAEDGQEAWELFQKDPSPVVITDWQMPRLDGLGLCRKVRACPRQEYTYLIVLTSLDSKVNYLEAIDAGTDDFLAKPFEEDLLAARLLVARRIGGMLTQARRMETLLPLCPQCRRIRGEEGQWVKVEQYLADRTKANVVTGACPECNRALREAERRVVQDFRKAR